MSEKDKELAIIQYLRHKGHYCQKIHSGSVMKQHLGKGGYFRNYRIKLADEGTPDIMACIDGHFVGIEVKKDPGARGIWERQWEKFRKTRVLKESWKRSITQHMEHEKILKAKGTVFVICSIEELERDLSEFLS